MNYVCIPENWNKPRFAFGDIVTLSELPSPLLWFGVVRGIEFLKLNRKWLYSVEIFPHSELLPPDHDSEIVVNWLEGNMSFVNPLFIHLRAIAIA